MITCESLLKRGDLVKVSYTDGAIAKVYREENFAKSPLDRGLES